MFTQNVKFFTEEQRQQIHEASMQVLEETGLLVHNEKARDIFKAHGCDVDAEGHVKIPHTVIEKYIKYFVSDYTFTAQDPSFDIKIPEEGPCVVTGSSAPNIIDPKSGEERRATSKDIANIAHLINELPGFNVFSISTLADDAPQGQFSLSRFYPALKNCKKPVRSNTLNMKDLMTCLDLGYTIAGSEAAYMERPFINHHYCPVVSPLTFDVESTEAVTYLAEKGLPVYTTVVPNAGMTSPMSMVGTLVVGNAEFLAINCYYQMIREGMPIIYAYLPTVADMRTGNYTPGAIETGMLEMAHTEMAEYYGVPSGGYIGLTNAHCNDAQNGFEVAMNTTGAVLAGASLLNMGGLLDSLTTFDFAKAIIDNEVAMNLKRMKRGMEFSKDELCTDLIHQVGPGGLYMDLEHTAMNMRSICFLSDLSSRDARIQWQSEGAKDIGQRAKEKADRLLSPANPARFSDEVDARVKANFPGIVAGDALWDY
ncbi:MAG: trimethylamine methyltransferase family protein [Clostridiales bacterium]